MNLSNQIISALTFALKAAEMGFPVFPTDPRTKKPLIAAWPDFATTEPSQIHAWWSQYPDAMIGAITGDKSGYFVLDIDVKDDENAFQKLESFSANKEDITSTLMVKTPSGGLHLYFSMPQGINLKNSASKLGAGIDIRANGGYIIFPGSVRHDGQAYSIIQNLGDK